jgi:hypothetical protein
MLNVCHTPGILYPNPLTREFTLLPTYVGTLAFVEINTEIYSKCLSLDLYKGLVLRQALTNFIMENK